MISMEGLSINEMAKKLGLSYEAVRGRLRYRKIEAIFDGKLYSPGTLKILSEFAPKGFQPGDKNPRSKRKPPAVQ
jgi:hypothetical protein